MQNDRCDVVDELWWYKQYLRVSGNSPADIAISVSDCSSGLLMCDPRLLRHDAFSDLESDAISNTEGLPVVDLCCRPVHRFST